jgi:hypothetical protein
MQAWSLGANSSGSMAAAQAGGGVDIGLSLHLSVRAVQICWLRTQLSNSTTNAQNDLLIGVGIVFHSGNR